MSEKVTTSLEFLKLIEDEAYLYLATGEQHYSGERLNLRDVFARFENNEALLIDFLRWALAKRGFVY
jgi:hypothetical protein